MADKFFASFAAAAAAGVPAEAVQAHPAHAEAHVTHHFAAAEPHAEAAPSNRRPRVPRRSRSRRRAAGRPPRPSPPADEGAAAVAAPALAGFPTQKDIMVQEDMGMVHVSMTVNGRRVSAEVDPRTLLVQFLRENLRLTGTHVGCDTSQCGACVVHVDGAAIKSCTTLAGELQRARA